MSRGHEPRAPRTRDDVGAAAWEVRLRRLAQADGVEMGHEPAKTP